MYKSAAIYHFTNESSKRPIIYKKQLNILKNYATSLGCTNIQVFLDNSLLQCEHPEFDRLLSCAEEFDVLVTKDFYHISKNTMQCIRLIKAFRDKGVRVYTFENGSFDWQEAPFDRPLHIATYCSKYGNSDAIDQIIPVQNDILSLFAGKKTQWTVIDQYFDRSEYQNDSKQTKLMELLADRDRYDMLLVHTLNDIHWRTANFCKIREQLHLDIYSLQEGYLPFTKGGKL